MVTPSYLPTALRAYTVRTGPNGVVPLQHRTMGTLVPEFILTLDTETSVDAAQRLLFGSARVSQIRLDGQLLRSHVAQEILFYADELPKRDPVGFAVLRHHAKRHRLRFLSLRQFLERVVWPLAFKARGAIVGFNLPFDLSRLAYDCGEARVRGKGGRRFAGGFSFPLWRYRKGRGKWCENRYRPRVVIKPIDRSRALKAFSRPAVIDGADKIPEGSSDGALDRAYTYRGNFVDLHQLGFAMDDKRYSLSIACKVYGVEHGKSYAPVHGHITDRYIKYNRRDVLATEELFCKMLVQYLKNPIDLEPSKAFSPASIAKAYLRAMGIRPILERQADFPKDILGFAMSAFYGGRAECRIRRTAVPVVHMDFISMYPTVFTLLGLWDLLTCERIDVVGATEGVRDLLRRRDLLQYCLTQGAWRDIGCCFVQIMPEGDILPVRARYGSGESWNIGVNPLTCREPLWFALADVIASSILGRAAPCILRAVRLIPQGAADSLRSVRFRGTVSIDPREDNFFKVAIEERKRGSSRQDTSPEERARLDLALKIVANAGAYGIFAELNRQEHLGKQHEEVALYGYDGAPVTVQVSTPEALGEFAFPPLAASVTAGARLMLALLERFVRDSGGVYVFCDTDSMSVVSTPRGGLIPCPGGPNRSPGGREAVWAVAWEEVERIRQRFAALNPYDQGAVKGSILRLERANFGPDTRVQCQLYCYAISAKRYMLYTVGRRGKTIPHKWSEHGLGLYLNPTDPDASDRQWIRAVWEMIVAEDSLGRICTIPRWSNRPAITRITVSSPALLRPFASVNRRKSYANQIKPFNFLLTAHVAPLGHPHGCDPLRFHLITPWEPNPRKWVRMRWTDRYSGKSYRVTTTGVVGGRGVARLKTMGDVIAEYRIHPEPKSLGPDGRPCHEATRGLLQRRPVIAAYIRYVGKESNYLEERKLGLVHDADEVLTEYADPRRNPFKTLVLPVLQDLSSREIARKVGLHASTVKRIRNCTEPHPAHKTALFTLAVALARGALRKWRVTCPDDDLGCCYVYLEERNRRGARACRVCRKAVPHLRARYCSAACRHRAHRLRRTAFID